MRLLTTLCAVLLGASSCVPAPARAQSIFPALTAARFCQLKAQGVPESQAMLAAVRENWSQYRQPVYVTVDGRRTSTDALDAGRMAAQMCP
jgi:ActR/RegA family two-component response regulator